MKKISVFSAFGFLAALFLLACASPLFADSARNKKALDEFKQIVSTRYIYKDYKKVHWPSLYAKHEYKILASATDREFAENLNGLVLELKDAHFSVMDGEGARLPSLKRPARVTNYNLNAIRRIIGNLTKLNEHVSVGKLGKVGYLMITDWDFPPDEYADILPKSLFSETFFGTGGLIVDVRMNHGGKVANCERFAGEFASANLLAAYHHSLDRSGNIVKKEYYLRGLGVRYAKPVIVLMGNMSASACEHFILQMQTVAHVKTMGDNSAGSTGLPRNYRLSNGIGLTIPSAALMDLKNTYIEGYGIKPRETVPFIRDKSDNVLVKAFQKLGERVID
ncbi:MAG: hypothetical protein LBT31_07310 [Synergistaceae bacterium]|jgi:C-terminal processing protease CtpA/Prc|nr:hypothetical protein [Synergistaceae bacterium]